MTELVLAQGYTFFQLFAVLLLAWGITTLFYWRTFGTLSRMRFLTLLFLRFLSIAAVVFLLFRPMLQYTKENVQRKSIVFAADTSESMGIADGGTVRLDQVKGKIKQWTEKLKQDFSLHLFEFSDRAVNYPPALTPAEWEGEIAALKAEGKSTSLSWGLVGALSIMDGKQKVPPKEIEALFLFSDGQHNTVRKPADDAQRLGIPVYTIGVGTGLKNSSTFKDVQVNGIQVPESLTLNNRTRITAEVDAAGLEGRTVKVILEEETEKQGSNNPAREESSARKKLGEQELLLDAVVGPQDVVFEFKPEKAGRTLYIVRTELLGDEAIKENNERQKAALVVEPGIRVFYLEGTLRPEYGAIVERFLSKDPDLEFCAMVQTKPNVFQRRTNIEDFELKGLPTDQATVDSFDVFIIGDIDSSYFKPELQEMMVHRIKSGAGLIMLGGYHSLGPGGYNGTPLGKILPVILGNRDVGQFSEPFMPELTPDGVNSTVFANIGGFFPSTGGKAAKDGLPNLSGCTKVLAPSPAATVLAVCPQVKADGSETGMPVLAVQPVDNGRTAVFTGDTTRSWQQGPRAMNQDTPFMQFWGQFIRYMAKREGAVIREAGVSASTDKAYYEPEELVTITATLKDAVGTGTEKGTVSAVVIPKEPLVLAGGQSSTVNLEPVQGTPGKYIGQYQPKQMGRQEVKVSAKLDVLTLNAPEKIIIDIGRPNMEFDQLDLNEELLTKIADTTGGRYSHITTADFIIDQLNRDVMKRKVIERVQLAPPFIFWVFFVTVLTAEWIFRRRHHLR